MRVTAPGGDASLLAGSLRTLFGAGTLAGLTDGQLLERFRCGRGGAGEAPEAEAAFAALVERHGPMVLNVCRAVLGDRHDAEDACQAAFLVLARRAESIRRGDSVASWLYGVARRIAARARRDLARRRERERRRLERTRASEPVAPTPAEPWPELYEELDRLPEPFRAAVVLCDLEGHSYEQAAGLLSCPVGTVQSRLARGRRRLRHRLERRGIAPAVALVGIGTELATRPASAALSPHLAAAIARAAVAIGSGRTIVAAAPAAVAALAGAEIRRQVMNRLITMLAALLVGGLLATAAVVLAAGGNGGAPRVQAPAAVGKKAEAGPIHVRVIDLAGEAAAWVAVELDNHESPPRSFTTDGDGRAVIPRDALADGGWNALIARRGRETLAWCLVDESRPNRPAGTGVDPIVMQLLPLDHRVEGSVVDREGRPVAGVGVRLWSLAHPINGDIFFATALPVPPDAAVTDRAGRYVIQLPREADVGLAAVHRRYLGRGIEVPRDARAVPPEILEPAGSIVGQVIDGASGRPGAGAFIGAQLVEHRARMHGGAWAESRSDDQGRFVLGGAEPGVYNVLFLGLPGRSRATARAIECVRVRTGADTPADLTVIEGRPLRGIAVDRNTGEPVPGIQVGCYGPARPRSGAAVENHRADDRGGFTFHVPPGEQYVYLMDGGSFNRLAHRTVIVPEKGEAGLVRLMRQAARNRGMMGMMKAAVPVAAEKAAAPAKGKAEGREEVYKKELGPAAVKARPAEAKAPDDAPKVRTVTGHVRDPQGRPLAGVRVNVSFDGPQTAPDLLRLEHPMTDRDGLFLYPDLPRRPLQMVLNRDGSRYQIEDLPADRDEVEYTFKLTPDSEAKDHAGPASDEPIPPGLRDRLTFVELDPWGTDYLTDGPGESGNDLNRVPRGIHKLGETYFRVGEEMVHVRGGQRPDLPQAVKGIRVRARGRVIHFLHGTQFGDEQGPLVGSYLVHYADGTFETIPLVYGRNLLNWWQFPRSTERATAARVAWTGSNDSLEMNPGFKIRLFDLAWTNPHPEKEIATLDVLSADKGCDPFLVAFTLDRGE